jgi:hypothetical protein
MKMKCEAKDCDSYAGIFNFCPRCFKTKICIKKEDWDRAVRTFVVIEERGDHLRMEDLRMQLGESIPGVFIEVAGHYEIGMDELQDKLRYGLIDSKEFLEWFVPFFHKRYRYGAAE